MNHNTAVGRARPDALVRVIEVTKRHAPGGAPARDLRPLQPASAPAWIYASPLGPTPSRLPPGGSP
jgi:hypothetical protein